MQNTPATENADYVTGYGADERDRLWLDLSRDAYESSQNYFNTSLRREFENAMAHFNSRHAPGSKYLHSLYRNKSRTFRPKTRSAVRNNEMAVAVAMFSTQDVVHVTPVNDADDQQVLAAEIKNQVLNDRLNDPDMNWFMTCIGGSQDAMTMGAVVSRQEWKFKERERPTNDVRMNEDGSYTVRSMAGDKEVIDDRPIIDIVPLENIRLHPGADWRDPIKSSPYVIELVPMTVEEVRSKASKPDMINPDIMEYREVEDMVMRASIDRDWDSVRRMREGSRVEKYDRDNERINEYKTVWVHRNIVRVDDYDYCYDTLGPDVLLSTEVVPIEERYLTGDRPYAYGVAIIESHKLFPSGIPKLTYESQEYANDIANLRQDNVRLTLNKRFWVRRGAQVDVVSLRRNVAGGVTLMSDPERDIKESSTPDVTRSSYEEQDRINADFDDIAGNFSPASVQTNRAMNETVGGMNLMSSNANMMQEYLVRTVVETWAERALRQVLALIERYESDLEYLTQVASKHNITPQQLLYYLQLPSRLRVNVGFGSTNPQKRVEKLGFGLGTVAQYFPETMQGADRAEVVKEVMGALGYRDGARFFPQLFEDDVDPRIATLEQQIGELQQVIQTKQVEGQVKIDIARINQETALMRDQFKADIDGYKENVKARFDDINARLAAAKEERERLGLMLEREALSHAIMKDDREFAMEMRNRNAEADEGAMNLKGDDKAGIISRDNYGLMQDSPQ